MKIELDTASKKPIYEQIIANVKMLVMTSKLRAHEQVTSVRKLAKELQINPNTVQKAYAQLEKEGILYSVAGKGDYVTDNAARIKELHRNEITEMFEVATKHARDSGMWIDEIFTLVDEAYSKL